MSDDNDAFPASGHHRGVPLHAGQSETRLGVVRAEIDRAMLISDLDELVEWTRSVRHSPESRLLSGAKARAILVGVGEQRQRRPRGFSAAGVDALTAGLNSTVWANPDYYCSLLESEAGAGRREVPLKDDGSFGDAPS